MEQEPALAAAPASGIPPALWSDPDVRWLCGVHHAGGCEYLVRERYEELLWWLLMPSLLKLAAAPASDRAAVADLSREVDRALAAAEATGYRVEVLTGAATAGQPCEPSEAEAGAESAEPDLTESVPEATASTTTASTEPTPDE